MSPFLPVSHRLFAILVLALLATAAPASRRGQHPGHHQLAPPPAAARTVPGDLCGQPLSLGRGESFTVDLCDAWNDYDPGAFSCSPCALPGPEVVVVLDTQAGEDLKLDVTAAGVDVRLYLARECVDPATTCLVASQDPAESFQWTVPQGGRLFLFVNTPGDCGEVTIAHQQAASAAETDLSALKAIYR